MFARLSAVTIALALAIPMVLATPAPLVSRTESACNTGSMQCCQKTVQGGSPTASTLAALLGITGSVGEVLGMNCMPINVLGVGGNSCSQQTVCCTNNNFNGVVALGCTPINVGL
ncbi:hypothetical protein H1R20_g16002, partial [Candolleomyces eurysporus]